MKISFPMHFLIYHNPIICRRTQPCELGSGDHGQDVEYGPRHVERRHQHVRPDEHGVRTVGRHRVCGRGGSHQSHQRQCDVPGEKGVWASRDAQRQRADDVQPEGRGGHHRTVIDPSPPRRSQTRILYYYYNCVQLISHKKCDVIIASSPRGPNPHPRYNLNLIP